MPEELRPCRAFPCHCEGSFAKYIITYPNGEERKVSKQCAELAILCGYKSKAWNQRSAPEVPCSHVAPKGGHYCEKCGEFMGC